MSPVFTQEFAPDAQSQASASASSQTTQGSSEASRKVRASFTVLGLALSLGTTGSLVSSAEAADSFQLAALPSVTGATGTLPSFGSARPDGAAATYHTVADGETIWDIAKHHGVSVEDIKAANGIGEAQVIQAGQVLKVPAYAEVAIAPTPEPQTVALATPPQESWELPATVVEGEPLSEVETEPYTLTEFLAAQQAQQIASVADGEASPQTPEVDESDLMAAVATPEPTAIALAQPLNRREASVLPPSVPDKAITKPEGSIVSGQEISSERQVAHRVSSGETIWSIAQAYDVDLDDLQALNGISDPDFIVTGDELIIPVASALVAESVIEEAATRQPSPDVPYSMAAIEQKADPTQLASAAAVERATASLVDVGTQSTVEQPMAPTTAADPFIESLLTDVVASNPEAVSPEVEVAPLVLADASPELALVEAAETDLSGAEAPVAVNPQFADDVNPETLDADGAAFPPEQLLAAAPLGSEVYAPLVEDPAGRVVSPEMPVLPGQDNYLPEAPNRFEGYIWPTQGVLTSGYGWRWGRMHRGVDIAGPVGTPIYAAGPGVVVKSGWNSGGYGNLVDIRHPDGSLTRYAHNSRLMVREGQAVRQGQQIAEMGSTGYSTGPHLHFEIHVPSQGTVNPISMLPGR